MCSQATPCKKYINTESDTASLELEEIKPFALKS